MSTLFLSGYRLMWIHVAFDLPVSSQKQRSDARKFREFLLNHGFEMSQFSVYLRCVGQKETTITYLEKIKNHLPEYGQVSIILITDKQYEKIIRFSNGARKKNQNPDQLALF